MFRLLLQLLNATMRANARAYLTTSTNPAQRVRASANSGGSAGDVLISGQ